MQWRCVNDNGVGLSILKIEKSRYDTLSTLQRSERMSRIRGRDTKIEKHIRTLVCNLGYGRRYRLNYSRLPGKPDIVFPVLRKVILVHGCFWHLHRPCRQYRLPRTRVDFWMKKLTGNKRRDTERIKQLKNLGWDVLVLWECSIRKRTTLGRLKQFMLRGNR